MSSRGDRAVTIIIRANGGIVQSVLSSDPVKLCVLDESHLDGQTTVLEGKSYGLQLMPDEGAAEVTVDPMEVGLSLLEMARAMAGSALT